MISSCAAIVIAAKHGELTKVRDCSGITYTVGTLRCKFEFRTTDWDYTTRTAVFCKGNVATHPKIADKAIGVLLDKVDECAVPPEVLLPDERYFSVGVWGVTDDGLRIVSKWLVFRIEDGCYVDSTESIPPTPSVYEQILIEMNSKAPIEHDHDNRYYTQEDIDDKLPTKVSELENDKGYLTEYIENDPTVPQWAKSVTKPTYTAHEVGADPKGSATDALNSAKQYTDEKISAIDVSAQISIHNTNTSSHNDIRLAVQTIVNRLNAFLDTDNTTLDQLSEIIAYIKDNKELIESVTTTKVNISDIVDNLTTNATDKPLSARQGAALKSLIDAIVVPSKMSQLTNDAGYINSIPDEYVTESEIEEVADTVLNKAKQSGEFDGEDGLTPFIAENGNWWIGTTDTGVKAKGINGKDGVDGTNGKDGVSVSHEWNGTVLTVTSSSGISSVDLKGKDGIDGANGKDGTDGKNGTDGISPTVTFAQNDSGYTMNITDANGIKSIDVLNGKNGVDGKDGLNGKDGINGKDGKDGENGYTPQYGVDYMTQEDVTKIVNEVLDALPDGNEVGY